ncbi:alcohol oxidase [Pholiota conissans]|uniref:pyranose dehydrogenase (acceptor) n=1 Tax=Pholiota conissans TaxID=109636 RepID=A0A9P5Z4T8_9AGAR|nr:alcohol oxidase [Pholiota conissans]
MPSFSLSWLLVSSLLVQRSLGVTLTDPDQLKTKTYDFVIVGAGTAGLTLASRLTEDPKVSVLVLEAGVSDQDVLPAIAPFLGPTLTPNTPFDWNFTVTPQEGLGGRSFPYPRGKLIGGSSSANYMMHQYGSTEDWDRYARITKDAGWAWKNMRQYVKKHERIVPPVDDHSTEGQLIPSNHGTDGEVAISLPGFNESIDARVFKTTQELEEFPYNEDTSGADHSLLGIGFIQSSIDRGVRSSSSTGYLAPANGRPNLTVLINAHVLKVLKTGTKAFRAVEFATSPGSAPITIQAKNEVILSAGTIGTAQILQLSGIGNKADLEALGIPVLVDLPVGDNLVDHTFLPNIFRVEGEESFDHILRDTEKTVAAVTEWATQKTGFIANNIANTFGFARIPEDLSIFKTVVDPAPGPQSPHFEYIPTNFHLKPGFPIPPTGSYFTIVTVCLNPTSYGSVKLASADPYDKPLIDPRLLTTDIDLIVMRESVKATKRFVSAPAWSDYIIEPVGTLAGNTDDEIDAHVRGLATTIFHPVGTASMAAKGNKEGVVNPDLTVKGVEGLRVVDASIFPLIPSTHTQGPVYLAAERAAVIIKEHYDNDGYAAGRDEL